MVISRTELPNVMTLLLMTVRWSFSISVTDFSSSPFFFSQWILMRTFFSQNLASISGSGSSRGSLEEFLSELELSPSAKSWVFFTKTTDSMFFFLVCSSSVVTRSCSCFKYLIASPRTEALSICQWHKKPWFQIENYLTETRMLETMNCCNINTIKLWLPENWTSKI